MNSLPVFPVVTVESQIERIRVKLQSWGISLPLVRNSKAIAWIEWGSDPESGVRAFTDSEIVEICNIIQEDIESGKISRSELVSMGYN